MTPTKEQEHALAVVIRMLGLAIRDGDPDVAQSAVNAFCGLSAFINCAGVCYAV